MSAIVRASRLQPAIASAAALVLAASSARDLDVAIPPGPPAHWSHAIPALTPRREPIFPDTPRPQPGWTVAQQRRGPMEVRVPSSFGLFRVLTWDVTGHLDWVGKTPAPGQPITGRAGRVPYPPAVEAPMRWIATSALLRLLLHPYQVSRAELQAHLIEVGEPVLAAVEAARAEPSLAPLCVAVAAAIGELPAGLPVPTPGESAKDTMLRRFVLEELCSAHPYDPEQRFGRRLYLFGEDLFPYVRDCLSHEHSFVRRNAVAALGHYQNMDAGRALLNVACMSPDKVARLRALSLIARRRFAVSVSALLRRLTLVADDDEAAALLHTIGSLGQERAVAGLLEFGDKHYRDPDLVLAVLTALARIPTYDKEGSCWKFVSRLERLAHETPGLWQPKGPHSNVAADLPDHKTTRSEMVAQLATLAMGRLRPTAASVRRDVLDLGAEVAAGPTRARFQNESLRGVYPAAQYLYLEVLELLGEDGVERLQRVADDESADPVLRAHATQMLPGAERASQAEKFLASADEVLRLYAFELLEADGHPRLRDVAEAVLKEFVAGSASGPQAESRYRCLLAIKYLGRERKLEVEQMLAGLAALELDGSEQPVARSVVGNKVRALVTLTLEGKPQHEVREELDRLLDFVVEYRVNASINRRSLPATRRYVLGQLQGLRNNRDDAGYRRLVEESLYAYLLALPNVFSQGEVSFRPYVPLEESYLIELGRTGSERAVEALGDLVRRPRNHHRAICCLALGATARKEAVPILVPLLLDLDPFVRYCAWRSLVYLTEQDHFADWLYGTDAEHKAAMAKYRDG